MTDANAEFVAGGPGAVFGAMDSYNSAPRTDPFSSGPFYPHVNDKDGTTLAVRDELPPSYAESTILAPNRRTAVPVK